MNFQIKMGENFISPPVKTATGIAGLLAAWGLTIGMQISNIKRMNSSGALESYASGQFTTFEPGKGYIFYGLANSSFNYGKTETVTTFVYDSTGARVKKITAPSAGSGQATSTSIYLGKDYDVTGSLTPGGAASLATKYIFLGDRRISMKDSSGALLFYHEDHINSSNVITDATGNQAALYEYDPYGSTVTQTGSVTVKHRFTGQEADDSTRLYHYGGRYYDPQLGRFITADPTIQHPTDPQDFNRYAYARNNPILYNDPTGFGFWKSLFRFFTKVYSAVMGGVTAAVVFAATGDRHLAAGLGVAVYRGLDARLNGASWAESLRAAARGYYEGVSLVNGDRGAAISIIVNDPDTGLITRSEVKAGAKQNQSALSELAGLTLVAAAVIATSIENTTAANAQSSELSQSAKVTNQIHFDWDMAVDNFSARLASSGPGGPLSNLPSGGGFMGPGGAGEFVPGAGYAQAVSLAMGVGVTASNVVAFSWKGKEGKLKGGKQGKRDRWFGDFPRAFQKWFHRNYPKIAPNAEAEEIRDYYDLWQQLGRPKAK